MLGELLGLIAFEVLPSATPTIPGTGVYPQQGQGFAAYLVGGFFGLGLIVLVMVLLNLRPRRADPDH